MIDAPLSQEDKAQTLEVNGTAHESDAMRGHMAQLLAQVPRLAVAAAVFFTTVVIEEPDVLKGPHSVL
jgi:negative regulator of sigma E activity